MTQKAVTGAKLLSDTVIEGLLEKKGQEIVRMDLMEVKAAVTNYFVICTGTSDKHVQALSESVLDTVRETLKEKPVNVEGAVRGEWILLDYVDVVVHIFQAEKRDFYNLEELWGDAVFDRIEE